MISIAIYGDDRAVLLMPEAGIILNHLPEFLDVHEVYVLAKRDGILKEPREEEPEAPTFYINLGPAGSSMWSLVAKRRTDQTGPLPDSVTQLLMRLEEKVLGEDEAPKETLQ